MNGIDAVVENSIYPTCSPSRPETLGKELSIGNTTICTNLLQAPMAGFTDRAVRDLFRSFGGCGLPAFEMISADHLVRTTNDGCPRLDKVEDETRPLAIQVWDDDIEQLSECATRLSALNPTVLDVNFGCPDKKVIAQGSGAALLEHPDKIQHIVETLVKASSVPVTAKIRLGLKKDSFTAIEVASAIEAGGASLLTVHGRTASQMYKGEASWDAIASVKQAIKSIPVIGNGDIRTPRDVAVAMEQTGVDGVMIGRGALGKPWLFRDTWAYLTGKKQPCEITKKILGEILLRHQKMLVELRGEHWGNIIMRKHSCCYATGFNGAKAFRTNASTAKTTQEFCKIVTETFFKEGETKCEAL